MMPLVDILLPILLAGTVMADSGDNLVIVDDQAPAEATKLPNSHSAALVMALIFLCVFAYGAYRFCRCKCGMFQKQPLTVSLSGGGGEKGGHVDVQGLDNYIKEREAYLAIYGPKNIRSVSGGVDRTERGNSIVVTITPP